MTKKRTILGFLVVILILAAGLMACDDKPDRSLTIQAYAPLNQESGKTTPVMQDVKRLRIGVFEKEENGSYTKVTTYPFQGLVQDYYECSARITVASTGNIADSVTCQHCVEGECKTASESSDSDGVFKIFKATCQAPTVSGSSNCAMFNGENVCVEINISGETGSCQGYYEIDPSSIDEVILDDLPTSTTVPYYYLVEGYGNASVYSQVSCDIAGTSSECDTEWYCRTNPNTMNNVCTRTTYLTPVARGISAPTIYNGDDAAVAEVFFSLVSNFGFTTLLDGSNSTLNGAIATTDSGTGGGGQTTSNERAYHESLALPDGKVLLVGGEGPASATGAATYPLSGLLFDPDTNEFNEIALSGLSQGRAYFAMVPVAEETSSVIEPTETDGDTSITTDGDTTVDGDTADGDAVVDGDSTGGSVFSNMQEDDTTTKRFFIIGGKIATGPTGEVLYGTYQSIGDEAAVALQAINGTITPVFQLATATLPDGKILITGGYSTEGPVKNAYVLDPFNAAGPTLQQVGAMQVARYRHTATTLPSGHVVIVGGMTADGSTISDVEVYDPDTMKFSSYEASEDETASDPLLTSRAGHIAVPLVRYNADGTVDAAGSRVAIYGGYRVLEGTKTYFNNEKASTREVDVPLIDFQGKVYPYTPTYSSGYFAAQKLDTLNQGRANTQVKVTSYHLCVDSEWAWLGDSPSTVMVFGGRGGYVNTQDTATGYFYSDWLEVLTFVQDESAGGFKFGKFLFGADDNDNTQTPFKLSSMNIGRGGMSVTPLQNGMYLVAGGKTSRNGASEQITSTGEIFNPPVYNSWTNDVLSVIESYY